MRPTAALAAILLLACSSESGDPPAGPAPMAPAAGTGGSSRPSTPATGGAGSEGQAGSGGAAGGSGGSGGASRPDAARQPDAGAGADRAGIAEAPAAGGQALFIVGRLPLMGTDAQIQAALAARGLDVQTAIDGTITPASAAGKRVVVISYSVESANVRGKLAEVTAPIIVMEHVLLADLGMTSGPGHGWKLGVAQISMTATETPLRAGLSGDVAVFVERTGEVFWGTPGPGAINVATVKGAPAQSVIFAYPAGAMMVGRTAPGKRLQFFFGAHEHAAPMLNPAGLDLLAAAIAWSIE